MQQRLPWSKVLIIVILAVAIIGVFALKRQGASRTSDTPAPAAQSAAPSVEPEAVTPTVPVPTASAPRAVVPAPKPVVQPETVSARPAPAVTTPTPKRQPSPPRRPVAATPAPPTMVTAPQASPAQPVAKPAPAEEPVPAADTAVNTETDVTLSTAVETDATDTTEVAAKKLPRFIELGSDTCVPCKMMQSVLKELRTRYAGKLKVEFIDIHKNPDAEKRYRVISIPTQVILDAQGKEVYRHIGYWPTDEIVAKLKTLKIGL